MVNVDLSNLWIEDMKWGCDFPNFRYFWDHGFWMIKFQEILSSGDLRPVNKSGRGSMRGGEVSWADVDVGGSSAPQCGLVPNWSSYSKENWQDLKIRILAQCQPHSVVWQSWHPTFFLPIFAFETIQFVWYKPHIFWKHMTATIHWPHKNPSDPPDPQTQT